MNIVDDYYKIIENFLEEKTSVLSFKEVFLKTYLNEQREFDDNIFEILDNLFAEVDLYTSDLYLLENFDLYVTENQLRQTANKTLHNLRDLHKE